MGFAKERDFKSRGFYRREQMTGIVVGAMMMYVLVKMDAPWFMRVILIASIIADFGIGAYKVGKGDKE